MNFRRRMFEIKQSLKGKRIQRTLLEDSQYWDAEQMMAYQVAQLRALLIEAGTHVPYYRDQFASVGFDPRTDVTDPEALHELPILTKAKARELKTALLTERTDVKSTIERTSGSTGEPFAEHISEEQLAFEKAHVWRHWSWAGWRIRDRVAIVRSYVPEAGESLILNDTLRNFRYYSAYRMDEANTRDYVLDMMRWRPKFLRGYPSSLEILANVSVEMGVRWTGVCGIFTASETLTDAQRQKIEAAFDSRIFDWYGLAEMVVSANECEAHDGLHLNPEYGIWELQPRSYLNSDERMIIGTNLHNRAMPLIRYETGDIAVVRENATHDCACGRTLPKIRQIRGRKDDILTAVDGRPLPSVNFYSLFREFEAVKRFQLIQTGATAVELRLVADNLAEPERRQIEVELRKRLGQGMSITMKRTGDFLKNAVGKRRPVISLIGLEESDHNAREVTHE